MPPRRPIPSNEVGRGGTTRFGLARVLGRESVREPQPMFAGMASVMSVPSPGALAAKTSPPMSRAW